MLCALQDEIEITGLSEDRRAWESGRGGAGGGRGGGGGGLSEVAGVVSGACAAPAPAPASALARAAAAAARRARPPPAHHPLNLLEYVHTYLYILLSNQNLLFASNSTLTY